MGDRDAEGSGDRKARRGEPESWFAELAGALGWNPLIGADLGPVLESCGRAAESWVAANRVAPGAALAVAECQFRLLKQVMEDAGPASDPQEAAREPAWHAVLGFEGLRDNLHELMEVVARSQVAIAEIVARRLAEMVEEVERYRARLDP